MAPSRANWIWTEDNQVRAKQEVVLRSMLILSAAVVNGTGISQQWISVRQ